MLREPEDKYKTVGPGPYHSEIKIQGSQFITHVFHSQKQDDAIVKYEGIKKKYHDATHNCYAYRIDKDLFRYSDDGEPSGTAGRPMLQIIEGLNLIQVLAVVTRYFCGTKLGTGGLIRAYSEAVKKALEQADIVEKTRYREIRIVTRYELQRDVHEIIQRNQGNIVSSDFTDKVILVCRIPLGKYPSFQREIMHKVEISEL